MDHPTPESRTDRLTISVTPREKLAAQMVAMKHGTDVSGLLRERLLPELMREAEEIRLSLTA